MLDERLSLIAKDRYQDSTISIGFPDTILSNKALELAKKCNLAPTYSSFIEDGDYSFIIFEFGYDEEQSGCGITYGKDLDFPEDVTQDDIKEYGLNKLENLLQYLDNHSGDFKRPEVDWQFQNDEWTGNISADTLIRTYQNQNSGKEDLEIVSKGLALKYQVWHNISEAEKKVVELEPCSAFESDVRKYLDDKNIEYRDRGAIEIKTSSATQAYCILDDLVDMMQLNEASFPLS